MSWRVKGFNQGSYRDELATETQSHNPIRSAKGASEHGLRMTKFLRWRVRLQLAVDARLVEGRF